jgi:hypothetical protein
MRKPVINNRHLLLSKQGSTRLLVTASTFDIGVRLHGEDVNNRN